MKTTIPTILAILLAAASVVHAHEPIPVNYTTSDGVNIVGDYWTPIDMSKPAPAIILLHMYQSERKTWYPQIVALEYAGFAIMIIDMRGHGESVEPASMNLSKRMKQKDATLFNAMHLDVEGGYQWLAKRKEVDLSRLALVGASVGCSVALDYAHRDKSVDVIALLSPGKNYLGIDSLEHMNHYGHRALLMFTSEDERSRGFDELLSVAKSTGVLVESDVFDQEKIHGTHMYGKVTKIDKRIAKYLQKQVGEGKGEPVYAAIGSNKFYPKGHAAIEKIKPADLRIFSSAKEAIQRELQSDK